ncbi:MAG: ATP-binding protein [Octadecabacter sp.]
MHDFTETRVSRPKKRKRFVFVIVMLVAVFVLGLTYLVRSDYNRTLTGEAEHLEYFAELFEQSIESGLATADLQISKMTDQFASEPLGDIADIEARYGDLMRTTLQDVDQIDSMVLIAPNGTAVWSSVAGLNDVYLGDRAYFRSAIQRKTGEFAVGVPLLSRADNRRLTPIAWPVISSSNEILGVVASSLGEQYFSDLLSLNKIAPDMHVDILASNGAAAFLSEGSLAGKATKQIRTSREISSLGLTITVSRSQRVVMAGFYQRTAGFLIVSTILFATLIGMAIRLQRKSNQLASGLTQSRLANQRIVAAQREFNAVFENVGDGIVIFTSDGKLNRSNKKARHILGEDNNAEAIKRLQSLLPASFELDPDMRTYQISGAEGEVYRCRVMKLTSNNQEVAYCVLSDISAEDRLTTARSTFVTSINHELRTPLTSLSGSLQLLNHKFSDDLPEAAKRLVAMASRNADRLLTLVNDILTLQAIDQGQFHVDARPVDVDVALEDAIASNSGYGLGTGVELVCERSAKGQVFADPGRLQQIFSNLISNAIKYSPKNGTVKIGAVETKDEFTFYVRDNGPGIPVFARDRLFDRFATPIHESGVQMNGTGLGLAITKQLVERQGGTITFDTQTAEDNALKSGTTFFVTFKLHNEQAPMLKPQS